MNNLGFNPGFNQMTGDMQFQHHPSQQGPQNQMQMYQNSGYRNKRGKIQTLVLDVKDGPVTIVKTNADGTTAPETVIRTHLGNADEFKIDLFEPLEIDTLSVISLDNLITFNCNLSNTTQSSAFCLHINEFNIETNVAAEDNRDLQNIFNSIVIPNENNDIGNYGGAVLHKSKKMNHICYINPCTISSLSGRISNLIGGSAFHGISANLATRTYILSGISTFTGPGATTPISRDSNITGIAAPVFVDISSETLTIPADIAPNSAFIIFSSTKELTLDNFNGISPITMTIGGTEYTFNSTNGFMLTEGHGRFVAEFKIESVE